FMLSKLKIIFKKGDEQDIKNYRPLAMLNGSYKIIAKAIAIRVKKIITKIIPKEQTGFVNGRNIKDNIMNTLMLIEEANINKNIIGAIGFIDITKAFDTLSRNYLYKTIEKMQLGEYFKRCIYTLLEGSKAKIEIGKESEIIAIDSGVKQGCPLSPYLY